MSQSDIQPAPGVLLIAPPMLEEPNFRRTVVLLCEHGEEGSFGLILNRPLALHLQDVLDDVRGYDAPLSLGGPVQPNTLHFLHRFGDRIPGAAPVLDGVYWGGDFEVLKAHMAEHGASARELRFFLGYAGWSAGQLEEEIEDGGWFLAKGAARDVFTGTPSRLWRLVLRNKGGEYALLSNFPDDPRLN